MSDVVHIAYPGVGGQAGVAIGLAKEAVRRGESMRSCSMASSHPRSTISPSALPRAFASKAFSRLRELVSRHGWICSLCCGA